MKNKKEYLDVIGKLSHSGSRVPYTYHHDKVRQSVDKYRFSSRSEIAQIKEASDEELYATCLTYVLETEADVVEILNLNDEDIEGCKEAIGICIKYLKRLTYERD